MTNDKNDTPDFDNVARWDADSTTDFDGTYTVFDNDPTGTWVRYDDYERLLNAYNKLKE